MKKLFFVLMICFVVYTVKAQEKKQEEKPVIEFESTSYDFGKIYEGKPASHEFIFTNKGKVPLVLSNVKPSCGCTTPEWPKEPIMPGQKGKIKAIYNPGNTKGSFGKGISVFSNASPDAVQLTIKGSVEEKKAEPQSPVKIQQQEGGF